MKVLITNKYKNWDVSTTGKGKFIQRLIPALRDQGVQVFTDPKEVCDIQLGIGKFVYDTKCTAKVLRLGPVHFDVKDHKKLNRQKKKAYKSADGVIYQSYFCKKMARSFFGRTRASEEIIFNGADPEAFNVSPIKSDYKYNFLAATRTWTPQKRLDNIIDAFWKANIPDSCLLVCGYVQDRKMTLYNDSNDSAVEFTGILGSKRLARVYNMADAFVNITYLDACPNAVVEAIVADIPVIGGNDSGVQELVLSTTEGRKLNVNNLIYTYNFKPVRSIPNFPVDKLSECFLDVVHGKALKINPKPLYIHNIATQYVNFFREVLCQK